MIILPTTDHQLRNMLQTLAGAVLDYDRLSGFLFAVACSPEPVKPSEWFELIWLDDDPQFNDEDEAKSFIRLLKQAMTEVEAAIDKGIYLPFDCPQNEMEKQRLALWCEGFLFAHQYLEELWDVAVMDLDSDAIEDAITAALNLAAAFTDSAYQNQLSLDDDLDALSEDSEQIDNEKFQEAYQWFSEVLAVYADVANQWRELQAFTDVNQLFLALEPVAKDQPCPCGSGLPFAKCCLH